MQKTVTIPLDDIEKLLDLAARAKGINDTPTLILFAEVRWLIEKAQRA